MSQAYTVSFTSGVECSALLELLMVLRCWLGPNVLKPLKEMTEFTGQKTMPAGQPSG